MTSIPAPLRGKVAVVTGGSRGIGRSIAVSFARHGVSHLAITYQGNKAAAEETLSKAKEANPALKTFAFAADVTNPDSGSEVVQQTLKGLGVDHIDIMVSNAALLDMEKWAGPDTLSKADWDLMMTATAWTPFLLTREAVKVMPKGGRIILISSGASKMASGGSLTLYSTGKAAVDAVARNLAATYGVEKGVTINSISVGATLTDALALAKEKNGPEWTKTIEGMSLLNRMADPQEVANIVAFIASPEASWIHGNNVPANGGSLLALQG